MVGIQVQFDQSKNQSKFPVTDELPLKFFVGIQLRIKCISKERIRGYTGSGVLKTM
jgi:hypothetical protein